MSTPSVTPCETINTRFPQIIFVATEDNPPNLKFLQLCTEYLGGCAQSHPHRLHNTEHRYMTITGIMWAFKMADAYPARQVNLGPSVTYPKGASALQRAHGDAAFSVQFRHYQDEMTMDHTLKDWQYELLGPFTIDLKEESIALGTPTFL